MASKSALLEELEDRLLKLIKNSPKGVTDKNIQKSIPGMSTENMVKLLNKLISQGTIGIYEQGKKIIYKMKLTLSNVESLKGADNEEKVVHRIIEESGNRGIWIRDIRTKSNLNQTQLNKVIKNLERKKLIKSVTTVTAGKKKVFMLYELEPDRSLTGGIFFCDNEFDSEYVEVISRHCYNCLKLKMEKSLTLGGGPLMANNFAYCSVTDIHKHLSSLNISKQAFSEDDVKQILNSLMLNGNVERKIDVGSSHLYKIVKPLLPPPGLAQTPCGVCPVFRHCEKSSAVNPQTCSYLNDWLA